METIRKHYIFLGQGQGAGFRDRAANLAHMLGVTGWVRNLWDGTVEMEVQGTRADIWKLVSGLREQRFIHVEEIRERTLPVEEENSFRVR